MSKKQVPLAKAVHIATVDDAESSVIRFQTAAGDIDIGLKNKELSKLVMLLLGQSQKVAIAQIAETPNQKLEQIAATVHPVQCSSLGIGKGRTESEKSLLVQVGNIRMAFWTDTEVIEGLCSDLRSQIRTLEKPQRPN